MAVLDTLERKFSKYIPPYITQTLLIGQAISYLLVYTHQEYASYFYITGNLLLHGQIWRLITILFTPVSDNLFFAVLALYFFYMLGTALESQWGSFRYLVYILIGYLGTIVCAFIFPDLIVSNTYVFTSLFLAFAHLYPNFQVLLFFILPIKVKWLGLFAWLGLIVSFLFGPLSTKVLILLSISNFFIFFADDLQFMNLSFFKGYRTNKNNFKMRQKPQHICAVCGRNEIDDPNMDIRYCNQCVPETCYCGEHIRHHQHKRMVN